jgi:arabinogalactan oligomer/maltooligosaccharide transport system substrate-binding protein
MRRSITGIAGSLALVLGLAACGGDGESNDESPEGNENQDLSAELTWWDTSDPTNEGPAFQKLIERFNEEYPDVTIDYQSVPFGETQNKFKTAAESGSGAPDILRAEVAWVPEFASLGYLYALDGTALLEDSDDFLETPMSSNVYDGKTYGVPQVTDTLALLYNKKLLEQAGIDAPPTTWEELKQASATIKQETGVDGAYLHAAGYFALPFMYGEGGDLVDVDAEEIVVNSEANVTGLTTAQDLTKSPGIAKPVAGDEAYGTMMSLFTEGKVAMIVNGPWEVRNISDAPKFGGFENLGVAPVPAGSAGAGAPVGGHNYVIWSGMDEAKADAAIAFVQFMSSAESQAFIAEELGLLPTRSSAYELPEVTDNERVAAFEEALGVAVPRPWIPEGGQFFTPLDQMATRVLVQGADPRTELDKVAQTYKKQVVKDYTLAE